MTEHKQSKLHPASQDDSRARVEIDADAIRELSALLSETGLGEIEIEENGRRIRVSRQQVQIPVAPALAAAPPSRPAASHNLEAPAPKREGTGVVASPMVGTVYVAREPGRPPFVKPGDTVREGDTLLIVEAMKTMNPILAPHAGVIKEICVADAQPVEFGQALLILSPVGT
jgi:acetyl-CoA carboxylase biotin carboxyl carrier protein